MLFLLGPERYRLKGFFGFSSSELPLIYKIADVTIDMLINHKIDMLLYYIYTYIAVYFSSSGKQVEFLV